MRFKQLSAWGKNQKGPTILTLDRFLLPGHCKESVARGVSIGRRCLVPSGREWTLHPRSPDLRLPLRGMAFKGGIGSVKLFPQAI